MSFSSDATAPLSDFGEVKDNTYDESIPVAPEIVVDHLVNVNRSTLPPTGDDVCGGVSTSDENNTNSNNISKDNSFES